MSYLITFTIITLNSSMGRLPIFTSLNSSGVLPRYLIWNIFLCHHILPHLMSFFDVCSILGLFPNPGEVVFSGDSLCIQKHTPVWSPELYALQMATMWAAWDLLLTYGGRFITVHNLAGVNRPQYS